MPPTAHPIQQQRPSTIWTYKPRILGSMAMLACLLPVAARADTASVPTQLPRGVVPTHYAIRVTPDAAKMRFSATASVDAEVKTATKTLTLNANELEISSARLRSGETAVIKANPKDQTVDFTFKTDLKPGPLTLEMTYQGKINEQPAGLFALDYQDTQGKPKRALFTQFESPDARRFVPSWDEPIYKATFDLTAVVPAELVAVSNMPVKSRKILATKQAEVTFATTPKMSSYLLFFGLGEFDRITKKVGATEVGVVVGKGNASKAQYALDSAAEVFAYYNDYFGVPYPLPKLDNVAGPGQSQFFSAMENWGAIFTFEKALLNDPAFTSARGKQAIYSIGSHEIAHQWFGNLVTMQWWDDLWLNEGFASWMESKTTAKFNPTWQSELDAVDRREIAMSQDSFVTTHPVIQEIRTVDQTNQAFDAITYLKGEAIINMLEGFAGSETWKRGIRDYIKTHQYGNTKTDDLWNAIQKAGAAGVVEIAHDYTKQPGVPLITVDASPCTNGKTTLTLTQGEFSSDRKDKTDVSPLRWHVPVRAQSLGGPVVRTIVADGKGTLTVPGCDAIVVNPSQSGYFRTKYSAAMLASLNKSFDKLATIDQLGVAGETYSLGLAGYAPLSNGLDLVAKIRADSSAKLVGTAVSGWVSLARMFDDKPVVQKAIVSRLMTTFAPRLTKLGFKPNPVEIAPEAVLRGELIQNLAYAGDPSVLAEAKRIFSLLQTNPNALDGPLRSQWLAIIARNADQPTWDALRAYAKTQTDQDIKATLYSLLGTAKDSKLARQALELALTDEPGKTTAAEIVGSVAREHADLAFDFGVTNAKKITQLVDATSGFTFIVKLASRSHDPNIVPKVEAFVKANLNAESRKPADAVIAALKTKFRTEPKLKVDVEAWIAKNPSK